MNARGRRGFTLIELMVVIVIITLLMALLLPAIVKALCMGRQGNAETLIDTLSQAATMYAQDWVVYPPGGGTESAQLADLLDKDSVKGHPYFQFKNLNRRTGGDTGDITNPVFPTAGAGSTEGILYYRNNSA